MRLTTSLAVVGLALLFGLTCGLAAATQGNEPQGARLVPTDYNMFCLGVDSVVDSSGTHARTVRTSAVLPILQAEASKMEEAFIAYLAANYSYKGVRTVHCAGDATLGIAQAVKAQELEVDEYASAEIVEIDWVYPSPPSR